MSRAPASSRISRNSRMLISSSLLRNPFTSSAFNSFTGPDEVFVTVEEDDDLGTTFLFLGTGLGGADIACQSPGKNRLSLNGVITRTSLRNSCTVMDIRI